jgi:hypothetical protein
LIIKKILPRVFDLEVPEAGPKKSLSPVKRRGRLLE